MPYRRLPNTDKSRLKALKTAHHQGKEIPPFKLAFSQETLQRLSSFLPKYEKALSEYHQAYQRQTANQKTYQKRMKKARLYISHFIQVVNMSIIRGEMPPKTRGYYGLNQDTKRLPSLTSEKDLLEWGKKIIDGEEQRKKAGLPPVTNPTVAVVKVNYDNFAEAYQFQKQLQENHQRAADNIHKLRKEADQIIASIWDEVENTFSGETEANKRSKAQQYGVVYFFRKNELGRLNLRSLDDTPHQS
mgnify:CR=1 FL=1